MREPVRILSDLHLAHKVSRITRVSALRPLIAGAGTVVFNGDTWQEQAGPFHERSVVMLEELRSLCAEEGVDTVYLSGNHDPDWPGQGWVELAEGRVVITHGDALLPAGSPWKREILTEGERIEEIHSRHPLADLDVSERIEVARDIARELCTEEYPTGRRFIQRVWDAIMPPQRALRMLEAWATRADAGREFCERYFPSAEVLVIGHFHRAGSWRIGGRRVIDTGSFLNPGPAHWIEWHDGWLRRGVVDESVEDCRIGRILDLWRF